VPTRRLATLLDKPGTMPSMVVAPEKPLGIFRNRN
jgi:hypothetical protein